MPAKKPFDEATMHQGHRERLVNTAINAFEDLSEVQQMEVVLFNVFPRGDVNPLAHRLLHEFGSLSNVMDADVNSLKAIKGMGDMSAKKLKLIGDLNFIYAKNKMSKKVKLKNYSAIADYFEELLRFSPIERFLIVGLDASFRVLQLRTLALGSVKNVGLNTMHVSNFVSAAKPAFVIFSHNHPGGTALPSSQDVEATEQLVQFVSMMGVKFIDHILVGEDGVYSAKSNDFLRKFLTADEQ